MASVSPTRATHVGRPIGRRPLLAFAGIVGFFAVIAVLVLSVRSESHETRTEVRPAAVLIPLIPAASGASWSTSVREGGVSSPSQLLLNWSDGSVELVGPDGTVQGSVLVGMQPFAVLSMKRHELLVSDMVLGPAGLRPRLLAFDVDSLELIRDMSLDDNRATYAVYGRGVWLSADEEWFFYSTVQNDDANPACTGARNAAECDIWRVHGLNLAAGTSAQPVTLPLGCGWVTGSALFRGAVVVSCTDGQAFHLEPDGSDLAISELPFIAAPEETSSTYRGNLARALSTTVVRGMLVRVYSDGTVARVANDARVQTTRITPPETRPVSSIEPTISADGLVVLAYADEDTAGEGLATGYVVYDATASRILRTVGLAGIRSIRVTSDGTITALLANGSLYQELTDGTRASVPLVGHSEKRTNSTVLLP